MKHLKNGLPCSDKALGKLTMQPVIVIVALYFTLPLAYGAGEKYKPRTLKGHAKEVSDLAFSPDGKWLASSSFDETVRIWDLATGKELHTLRAHEFRAQGRFRAAKPCTILDTRETAI